MVDLLSRRSASTANNRFRSLQRFFKWLVDEEHIDSNPMATMKPPKGEDHLVPVYEPAEIQALVGASLGDSFEDVRDTAIILLLVDTGIRRAELVGLTVEDVDIDDHSITVLGKGARPRHVSFGNKVATALDKYEIKRRSHPHADRAAFLLGRRGTLTGTASPRCSGVAPNRPELRASVPTGSDTPSPTSPG